MRPPVILTSANDLSLLSNLRYTRAVDFSHRAHEVTYGIL